jgi:2-polyprenyl-6-methoxyphenol hydroxylase-like FAD-dependent oxidoreductase
MDTIDTRPTTSTLEVPVLVVGAGPVGLVTAIGLARQGVRSLVIERHASTSIFPRATGVSVRSMEIFRGWGIDTDIQPVGWRVKPVGANVTTLADPPTAEIALGFSDEIAASGISPASAAVSPQDHIEPVLVEHYRSVGMGEIRFSTELVAFDQDAAGVTATIRDRVTGSVATVRSRYLVGADGHRSTVRDLAGISMEGPDDLGQYLSILFRADLDDVLGDMRYGLYMLPGPAGPDGPPRVVVPSGADDRYVLGIPLPPGMNQPAIDAAFSAERCIELVREAAGRPDLEVEIVATNAFAFSAQVADRMRDGRVFLVGDSAHRMTPRGGRGMNTAIADAFDLGWKLAWVCRGVAGEPLLDTYEAERGPIGRRNVELSMVPGGGSDDGLAEEGFVPSARPGARATHAWLAIGEERLSTLDLFGRELVLLTAGDGAAWREASAAVAAGSPETPVRVRAIGRWLRDADGTFAERYGLDDGGAVLVRPDGIVAWHSRTAPADPAAVLRDVIDVTLGRCTASGERKEAA